MDALEALRTRRSVRRYDPAREIPRETLGQIVDCGRLAASARNTQPWEFVVVTDADRRAGIAALAAHGRFIADAPACIAVFCRDGDYPLEDGCAATQNILVAARAFGLGTCWVAGARKDYAPAVAALLGAPEGVRLVSLVAVGHPLDVPSPAKRPLGEVLHWENF
jgi:nitroreductase